MIFGLLGGDKKRVAEMIAAARTGDTEKIKLLLSQGADINAPERESGDTPLLAAIDKGQWATAEYLLTQQPDLGLEDKNGQSALYLAVSRGDSALAMVNLLLMAGAVVELGPKHGDNAGATPLHIACATGANGCLESLLRHRASATKPLPSGATPMHTAAIGGDQRTIELLCKAGGSVTALYEDKRTPLHNCGITGNATVAAALIQHGAPVDCADAEGCTPLMRAVMQNHAEVAKVLLDHGANPDVIVRIDGTPLYPLFIAAMNGYDNVVRVLLGKGVNVTAKVEGVPSPVDAAMLKGHEASAKLITAAIKKQKAAEKKASTAAKEAKKLWQRVVMAVATKDEDSLRTLISARAFASLPVDYRLLTACAAGDAKIARDMLQAGADPNKPCKDRLDDFTPLVITLEVSQNAEVVSLLIGAGANVNMRMSNGLTPLMCAARNGASRCVDIFLDAGVDINAVEEEHGVGAFGLALNRLDLQLAEHLLARGAEPNFGLIETLPSVIAEHGTLSLIKALAARGCKLVRDDQRGRMAFVSARNSDPEVFDYLLNQGADPSEGNDYGYTPLILAALNNHYPLIRRYLARGDDATVRDDDGETALSLAIEMRHEESVAVLREFHVEEGDYSALQPEAAMLKAAEDGALGSILNLRDAGVSIQCCDGEGNSALMIAVRAGHHGVVRCLYHLGANINHLNRARKYAQSLAKASDLSNIVNTLEEFSLLDSKTNRHRNKLPAVFKGLPIYNAANIEYGRMSRPYKHKPPYDDDTLDEDDYSDYDEFNEDYEYHESDQVVNKLKKDPSDKYTVGVSINSKPMLKRLLGQYGLVEMEDVKKVERTPLIDALHAQDLTAVKKIIKGGGDVNEVDGEGGTPLFVAVLTRQAKLVEELLKLGADPNKSRPDGKGPLFVAVLTAQEKIAKTLLKGGADVDAPLSREPSWSAVGGCTALYCAALFGHLPLCKVLISSGASLEATNEKGYTPLLAAIQEWNKDVIDFLLMSGANVNPEFNDKRGAESTRVTSPLYIAANYGSLALVKNLLQHGADVNRPGPDGVTPLKIAAHFNCLEIVKVLLAAGADPNIADVENYTPLMNAVTNQDKAIVDILLKYNADPNIQSRDNPEDDDEEYGRSALMDAAFSGNVAIARELLKGGANPNLVRTKGGTALHSAVLSKSAKMVSLLLKSGANPNALMMSDDESLSALDLAFQHWVTEDEDDRKGGISDVLELMLKEGRPSDCSSLEKTALELVEAGRLEVVDLLNKHGFSFEPIRPKEKASELFGNAAAGDHLPMTEQLLLQIEADPNYKSPAGLSVLSLSARIGGVRFASLLLKAGANVMDRNSSNVLAYDFAVIGRHNELIDLLIEHMNQVVPAVDKQADDGSTALMRAAMVSDVKAIKELLAAGADSSRRDRQGESPLSYAVTHDLDEVVQALRAAGAEKLPADMAIGPQSIVYAGSQGALGTILDLLDSGTSIDLTDDDGNTALTAAAVHPGVVKVLAKRGADLSHRNAEGKTAYMIAAASNLPLMVETLKDAGSPIEEPEELDDLIKMNALFNSLNALSAECNRDKLLRTCRTGDAMTVSDKIAAGADVNCENDEGRTPLMTALSGLGRGDISRRLERNLEQIVASLLVAGADPNRGQMPALILAAKTGRLHLVNAMLRAGAAVDRTIGEGQTALFISLLAPDSGQTADERCALALLNAGADSSLRHESGTMPIHLAAASNYIGALQALLDRRPQDVDAKTNTGITPLMMAATEGHTQAVRLLLKFGADRTLKDDEGLTSKELAMKNGNDQLIALLQI